MPGSHGDTVQISNVDVSGNVTVNTDGWAASARDDETVSVVNVNLHATASFATGVGNDNLEFTNMTCQNRATVSRGDGVDQLTLRQSRFYSLAVITDQHSSPAVLRGYRV